MFMATDGSETSRNPTTAAILSSTGKISSGKVFLVSNKDSLCSYSLQAVWVCERAPCVQVYGGKMQLLGTVHLFA